MISSLLFWVFFSSARRLFIIMVVATVIQCSFEARFPALSPFKSCCWRVCVCVPKMNDAMSATSLCYWLNGPVEPNKGTNAFEPTHTLIPTLPLYLLLERKEQHIRTEHTDAWFVSLSLSFLIQMGKEKCSIYLFFFCLSTIYFLLWLAWFTTLSYCSG